MLAGWSSCSVPHSSWPTVEDSLCAVPCGSCSSVWVAGYFKLEVTGRHHTARLLPHEGLCFPALTKTLGASVGIDTTVKVE